MGVRLIKISSAIALISIVAIALIGVLKFIVFPSLDGRDISILDNGGTRIEFSSGYDLSLSGNLLAFNASRSGTIYDSCGRPSNYYSTVYFFEKQASGKWREMPKFSLNPSLFNRYSFKSVSLAAGGTLMVLGNSGHEVVQLFKRQSDIRYIAYRHRQARQSGIRKQSGIGWQDVVQFFKRQSDIQSDIRYIAYLHRQARQSGIWWQWAHWFSSYITNDTIEKNNPPAKTVVDIDVGGGDDFGTAVSLSEDGTLLAVGAVGDKDGISDIAPVPEPAPEPKPEPAPEPQPEPAPEPAPEPNRATITRPPLPPSAPENIQQIFNQQLFNIITGIPVSACSLPPPGAAFYNKPKTKGAVYLFEKQSDDEWRQVHKFSDHTASTVAADRFTTAKTDVDLDDDDGFGRGVSLSGNLLAVRAQGDDDGDTGVVYLFEKQSDGEWQQVHKFSDHTTSTVAADRFTATQTDVDLGQNSDFGKSVSLSGNLLAVGAATEKYKEDDRIYLFEKQGDGTWSQIHKFSGVYDTTLYRTVGAKRLTETQTEVYLNRGDFGRNVSLSGNLLAVGAVGATYLFPLQ